MAASCHWPLWGGDLAACTEGGVHDSKSRGQGNHNLPRAHLVLLQVERLPRHVARCPSSGGILASHVAHEPETRRALRGRRGWIQRSMYSERAVSSRLPLPRTIARVGSYFVATYPPFSVWTAAAVEGDAWPVLRSQPAPGVPLGMYLHIPFCRKRCHFCYFRVYTDRRAGGVRRLFDVLAREWERLRRPAGHRGPSALVSCYSAVEHRRFSPPSSSKGWSARLSAVAPWRDAEEVTFECEPGTLTKAKRERSGQVGVTRLSLGMENFDDRILELNGRAHRSREVFRGYEQARALDFPQINIDLRLRACSVKPRRLAAMCSAAPSGFDAGQRDHLSDGTASSIRPSAATCSKGPAGSEIPSQAGQRSEDGSRRRSRRWRRRAITLEAPIRR